MNQISSPLLAPANNQAIYQYNDQLYLLDEAFDSSTVLLDSIAGAGHFRWSPDSTHVAFIVSGQLKIVTVATAQVIVVPIQQVSQFEWGANTILYITVNEGTLYKWTMDGEVQRLLEQALIEAYSVASEMAIVKQANQLFALPLSEQGIGEMQSITVQAGEYKQVAFSFTGQYVAYIGETETNRHVYVYDFNLGITQNLTEMLDVYVGDAMCREYSEKHGVKEIQWTETDALYFLVSSDGDVRLYYADLYGSLFPASPESEHVVSYSVSSSGNWVLYAVDQPFIEAQLKWFDITIGEGRTIVESEVSKPENFKAYYEIIDIADVPYYMWGYVPPQFEMVTIVLSRRGRMLGNGYDPRLAEALRENKVMIYVNHPGAIGYGESYAQMPFDESEIGIQDIALNWLTQKTGRSITVSKLVNNKFKD